MLPQFITDFTAAAVKASPQGIAVVEQAIQEAIDEINLMMPMIDPEEFSADAFIPKSAFGAAERSPLVALHHAKAHAVMRDTLVGVVTDLENFKAACVAARDGFVEVDTDAQAELNARVNAITALGNANTGNADNAYNQAVYDNANAQATETNPDEQEG